MKLRNMLCLILISTSILSKAQENGNKIKGLKIGDKVPDLLISKIINNDKRSAKISDFNNQLLILDFWETTCGSCIEALPKLDSLQKKFGNKIKILAVTHEEEAKVRDFFNNSRFLKGLKPPCAVEDSILHSYFKHKIISHEVWIYKGVVKAFTTTDYVNAKNIQTILEEKKIDWPVKNDAMTFDPLQPIFITNGPELYNLKNKKRSYSGITGQRNGVDYKGYNGGIGYVADSIQHNYRTFFYNKPVVDLYKQLWLSLVKKPFLMIPGRFLFEVKKRSDYVYDPKDGFLDQWNAEHQICYEMVTAENLQEQDRLNLIIADLNMRLGLNVNWEKRMTECMVIVKKEGIVENNSMISPAQSAPKPVKIQDIIHRTEMWALNGGKWPIIVDETNFDGTIALNKWTDIASLKKELQHLGFDLIAAKRELELLVFTETR